MHHKDDSQEIYDGCWWVFNTDGKYRKLREWLLPRKLILKLLGPAAGVSESLTVTVA